MSRQIDGVLSQVEQQSWLVTHAIGLLGEIASTIGYEFDTKVLQQLDDLQIRLAEQAREVNQLDYQRRGDTRAHCRDARSTPGTDRITSRRSSAAAATISGPAMPSSRRSSSGAIPSSTSASAAASSWSCSPSWVCRCTASSPIPQLVTSARGRGLDVEQGLAVEYLRSLEPESLGGIVMIQVIEHLSPQQVIDFVALAAEKLRPGGKVVLETVNPASLYTYAAGVLGRSRSRPARAPQLLGVPLPRGGVREDRHRVPVAGRRERAAAADHG